MGQRLNDEEDIKDLIEKNKEMMRILALVRKLNLPDSWICAGFLRAMVWDYQAGLSHQTTVHDIDVVYFDKESIDYNYESAMLNGYCVFL